MPEVTPVSVPMRTALVLVTFLGFWGQGFHTVEATCSADEEKIWQELLEASLEKTQEARLLIEKVATRPASEPNKKLAEVLIEEWHLDPTADTLLQPLVVYAPKPDYSDLSESSTFPLKSPVVVLTGEVTPLGTVDNIDLKIVAGVKEIDERCVEAFRSWKYRPARGENGFVRSRVGATCSIQLK